MLAALFGIGTGSYALLDQTAPRWMSTPMLVAGVALAIAGLWSAGQRVTRSRYRPDRWRIEEIGVALSGVLVATGMIGLVTDALVRDPDLYSAPQVPATALVIVLIGLLPAVVAPPAYAAETVIA